MKTIAEASVKSEITQRIRKLTVDTPRRWGKMNAHQMVCHLNDAHLLVMGDKLALDKSTWMSRTVVRPIALRMPMRWPEGVPTVPEIDQSTGAGTAPELFTADHAKLLQLVDRFTAPQRDFAFARHPIFDVLSEWEWMRWAYLHNDHHLRQFGL